MDAGDAVDWSDRAQVIDYMVEDSRVLAGTAHPFDEARPGRSSSGTTTERAAI